MHTHYRFLEDPSNGLAGDHADTGHCTVYPDQLLQILDEPVRGNGLVPLAHQQIAAKLNVATGATTPGGVANDITSADILIGNLIVPPIGTGY